MRPLWKIFSLFYNPARRFHLATLASCDLLAAICYPLSNFKLKTVNC
jgi:hypothetical protein